MTDAHNPSDVQRFGMLGLAEAHQHYQPKTAISEPEAG
jgi:hypothetical protein